MPKDDVIKVDGAASQHDVQSGIAERSLRAGSYQRQDAPELYPDSSRRLRDIRDVSLRSDEGKNRIPAEVKETGS